MESRCAERFERFSLFIPASCASRTDYPDRHQLSSRHPQVGQREQRDHMRRVLGQPAEPHLRHAELTLDDPEGVPYLCAHAGLAVFALLERLLAAPLGQLGDIARQGSNVLLHVLAIHTRLCTSIARVGPYFP